jgi:hypothetical protein
MKRIILAIGLALGTVTAATPATAHVPNGKGLDVLESPIPLVCTGDQATTKVVVTPGGGATGWRVDVNGQTVDQHHVLSSFSITVDGTTVYAKTWGVKRGLASLDCSQTIFGTVIEATIHPLPGSGR